MDKYDDILVRDLSSIEKVGLITGRLLTIQVQTMCPLILPERDQLLGEISSIDLVVNRLQQVRALRNPL